MWFPSTNPSEAEMLQRQGCARSAGTGRTGVSAHKQTLTSLGSFVATKQARCAAVRYRSSLRGQALGDEETELMCRLRRRFHN